jgi:hypothetical protein
MPGTAAESYLGSKSQPVPWPSGDSDIFQHSRPAHAVIVPGRKAFALFNGCRDRTWDQQTGTWARFDLRYVCASFGQIQRRRLCGSRVEIPTRCRD